MTSKTIESSRVVGGDYFILMYSRRKIEDLQYYLDKFNFEDYWCLKVTSNQIIINYDELLEFKYSGYIFFNKDLYNIDNILDWCVFMKHLGGRFCGIQYLTKPTPPFNPNKIIIRK